MSEFKLLVAKSFSPYTTAVLVDPIYGKDAIAQAKTTQTAVLLSCEKSGYMQSPGGRLTELLQDYPSQTLKEMGADAIKLLLYFNPDAANASKQIDILKYV